MQIERAPPELFPRLAGLREEMAREMSSDVISRSEGWQERFVEFFRTRQARGIAQPFVAIENDEVIGMAFASVIDDYRTFAFEQKRGYINAVYVVPSERGHGIGRRLTEAAIAWLRDRGCIAVRLNPSAEAKPLYLSMGFVPSGELRLDL